MPQNITQYKLLISCPGDIEDEITLIEEAVNKFNELYSDTLGITIQTKHWRKSSYAQSGGKPQSLLNEQFIKECDAAVAIFWTKFGSPTDKYGSGTEEEIEIMLNSDKQVFMYFSDKSIKPSEYSSEGYQKIQAFKEKYKDKGIYFVYSTNEEFQSIFFAHLSQYFLSEKRISELTTRCSSLSLCSIDGMSKLCNNLHIQPFKLNAEYTIDNYREKIKNLIEKINKVTVETSIEHNNIINNGIDIYSSMFDPVKIDLNIISNIEQMANHLNLKLSSDFFDIGNLHISRLPLCMGGGLDGTESEIEKYNLINDLYLMIDDAIRWAHIERAFENIPCCKLVLKNSGTAIDEDVEIRIIIPKNALLIPDDFPKFEEYVLEFLSSHFEFNILFGIMETAEYQKYPFTQDLETNIEESAELPYFNSTDYNKKYSNSIKNVFCYSIFSDNDNYILKLSVDYIKHNTAIAFPTPILIKEEISKIEYTITSKNSPHIITGTLHKV